MPLGVPVLTARVVRRRAVELCLLWSCAAIVSAQAPVLESRLKAAFVSKFAQFVEWPSDALAGRQTLDLCVATDGGAERDLDALVAGERVSGRPLVVRRITQDGEVDRCHLLFLPASDGSHAPLLRRASVRPIVTVGDEPAFLDHGGLIRLRAVDGRIRFDINARAAQRVGLRVSSQLLSLAATVLGATP